MRSNWLIKQGTPFLEGIANSLISKPWYVFLQNLSLPQVPQFNKPSTVTTTTYSIQDIDSSIIFNTSGTCTVTLPSAQQNPGRVIPMRNIAAQTITSASSNVVPLAGGSAGTAILANTAGKWCVLWSDGTNWQNMMAN